MGLIILTLLGLKYLPGWVKLVWLFHHIFINGEGTPKAPGATSYGVWKTDKAPTGDELVDGKVYYLLVDCPGIDKNARKGETWIYKKGGGTGTWEKYEGELDL